MRRLGKTHVRSGCRRASDARTIADPVDKKALSERDICTKFITPAMAKGGWDVQIQVRENVHLTKGRVIVRGKLVTRGTAKFADHVLYAKPNANIPLAIVEAKDNSHGVGDGMQQGLGYALLCLQSPVRQKLLGIDQTWMAQPNINARAIAAFQLTISGLDEQRCILEAVARFLSVCDDLEAKLRRAEDRASKLVEAVVQEMVA